MKGKIEKIWENKLDDGRTYETISVNGIRYNIWNEEYFGKLKTGDNVEFNFQEKGKYKNIQDISVQKRPQESQNREIKKQEPKSYINPMIKKDRQIARMSCLKSALYLTQDLAAFDVEQKTDKIIDIAKKFEKYITDFSDFKS